MANHHDVFTRWQKGTQMVIRIVSVTMLNADCVSVLTVGGIGKKASIPYDKLQTYTYVRRNGQWLCAAFQNTEMSERSKQIFNH